MTDHQLKAFSIKISIEAHRNLQKAASDFNLTQNEVISLLLESGRFEGIGDQIKAKRNRDLREYLASLPIDERAALLQSIDKASSE